ncbi:MAG: NAD(P)-dependent oxidoreductase [Bacteroidota bacterium]
MSTVLLLESIHEDAHQILAQQSTVVTAEYNPTAVDAIITRGKGQVNADLIHQLPNLKVIARCGVGLNNVDLESARAKGLEVLNTPGLNAATVAEHTIGLMLMLQRQLYRNIAATKQGDWQIRNQYGGDELRGKTLGILGMGDIGQRVAKIATALEMNVVYWNRSAKDVYYDRLSLENVLIDSDIISIHLPLTEETRYLLDQEKLALCHRNVLIINTARAEIIEPNALLEALQNDKIKGYAADVPRSQSNIEKQLYTLDQVLLTPHIASLTARTYRDICVTSAVNVLAFLSGEEVNGRFRALR